MSNVFDHYDRLLNQLSEELTRVVMRCAEMERRMDNSVRHGKVTDVDTKKQLARVEIGERDGKPVKSAWVPYAQLAGDYKSHRPPTVGQQMTMFAPNGEVRQAMLLPFTWSDDNKSPSDKPDEHVTTFGKLKIIEKAESLELTVDKASIKWAKDKLTLTVGETEFELTEQGYTAVGGIGILAVKTMLYTGVDTKTDKTGELVATDGGPAKKHKSKV